MMKSKKLAWDLPGLIVPPLTIFDDRGAVDYAAMQREIDYVVDVVRPAAIAVAAVEAQEYHYLPDAGRRELIRQTVRLVDGRTPVIVGVSHASFRQSAELAALAHELGASAIQVLIPNRPSGGKPTTAEVLRYFELIAGESELPIVAYHNPGPGAEISLAAMAEVCALPTVVAMKESSRNQRYLGLLIADVENAGLAHVFATMEVLYSALVLGASGGTMPPPGAALSKLLVDAFRGGDQATAQRIHCLLAEMPARWVDHGLVSVMKESMRAIGLDCGDTYPPFGAMKAGDVEAIRRLWDEVERAFPGAVRPRTSVTA